MTQVHDVAALHAVPPDIRDEDALSDALRIVLHEQPDIHEKVRRAAETADAARSVLGASSEKRKLLEKEVANFPPAGRAGARMALYLLPLCAVCAVARLAYLLLPLMSFALQLGWPLSRQSTHPVLTGMHFSS